MDNKNILEKIKKLMSRAEKTTFEAEAQASILLAQKLMVENGISQKDLSFDEAQEKEVLNSTAYNGGRRVAWRSMLANILADNFRCSMYSVTGRGTYRLQVLGLKEDVHIFMEVFAGTNKAIEKLSKTYTKARKDSEGLTQKEANTVKNSYIGGFLRGLKAQLQEQVKQNDWGLILVKDALVVEAVEKLNLKTARPSKARYFGDRDASQRGYNDGYNHNNGSSRKELEG